MMLKRFMQLPLVRTVVYVFLGGWAGMIGGMLLALFGAGVSWLLFRASFAGVDFATVYAGYAGIAMLLGGLASAVLSGVLAVRTTDVWMDDEGCCGGDCEGGSCCQEEPEEMIVVEAPKM